MVQFDNFALFSVPLSLILITTGSVLFLSSSTSDRYFTTSSISVDVPRYLNEHKSLRTAGFQSFGIFRRCAYVDDDVKTTWCSQYASDSKWSARNSAAYLGTYVVFSFYCIMLIAEYGLMLAGMVLFFKRRMYKRHLHVLSMTLCLGLIIGQCGLLVAAYFGLSDAFCSTGGVYHYTCSTGSVFYVAFVAAVMSVVGQGMRLVTSLGYVVYKNQSTKKNMDDIGFKRYINFKDTANDQYEFWRVLNANYRSYVTSIELISDHDSESEADL